MTEHGHDFDLRSERCVRCGIRREQVSDPLGRGLDRLLAALIGPCEPTGGER